MRKRLILMILLVIAQVVGREAQAADIHLSGGGSDKIYAAIRDNWATGAKIILDDSQTYTETTSTLYIGPRNSPAFGRRSFSIEAPAGQSPTIALSGCNMVLYAGSADLHLGSNAGGTIKINAQNAKPGAPVIWYIGQEDGLASGQACQATLENLQVDFGAMAEAIVFGAGGNDGAPKATGAKLTLRNVRTQGGGTVVKQLYGPASYTSTVEIDHCQLVNCQAAGVELGAFQLGGANSIMNLNRSIFYIPSTVAVGDINAVIVRIGRMSIDHCDIINEAPTGTAVRGICVAWGGECHVTNSIVRGEVATALFGSTTAEATDSNLSGSVLPNVGFTANNCITEWPVYVAYGGDPSVADWFKVLPSSQSATFGTTPPLGSVGGVAPVTPNASRHWVEY